MSPIPDCTHSEMEVEKNILILKVHFRNLINPYVCTHNIKVKVLSDSLRQNIY